MSDRSYAKFTVPNTAMVRELVTEEGFTFDEKETGPELEVEDDESRGGGFELHDALVAAGVPYLWEWSGHYNYDAGEGAFIPGEPAAEIQADTQGAPVVRVDLRTGEVVAGDLDAARRFVALRDRFPEAARRFVAVYEDVEAV